jgi:cytoskeletal protein CcmA (bactofilin family)
MLSKAENRSSPSSAVGQAEAPTPTSDIERWAAPNAQSVSINSFVAADTTVEGNLLSDGDLWIDGTVKGDVRVERLTVSESGRVDGGAFAEEVEVRGRVTGSIAARVVYLHRTCRVNAAISHEQLTVETGATFRGRALPLSRPAGRATPPSDSATAPKSNMIRTVASNAAHRL